MLKLFVCGFLLIPIIGFAQNCNDFSNYPEGEEKAKAQHVIYRDFMDKEQYDDAFSIWQKLYSYSPAANTYHYIDGVTLYRHFIENATTETEINDFIDKIVDLYEQRLACKVYKNEGVVYELMAYDLYNLGFDNNEKLFKTFQKALELNGNKTSPYILEYFSEYTIYLFSNDLLSKEITRETYYSIEKIIKANPNNKEYQEAWKFIEETFKPYKSYFLTCNDWIEELKPIYEADKDNPEVFRDILKQLLINGCKRGNPFMEELIKEDSMHIDREPGCTEYNPDFYGIRLMKMGNDSAAIPYLKEAIFYRNTPIARKGNASYYLARIYHSKIQYDSARIYYQITADLKPNWGEPYLQIGRMYASSVRVCGNNNDFEKGVIVCAAIEMWKKAKEVEENIDSVDNLINKYILYVPTKAQATENGYKENDKVKIGCWIDETTELILR
ncbi:MAG: tetratricopeptide repeat protein [Saprospiraceae bacterium]